MDENDYVSRARTRQEAGDLDGAMSDVDQALRLDRRHAEAYHVRGHIRRDRGRYWRAIRDFKRAARLAPLDYRNFYCRAVARRRSLEHACHFRRFCRFAAHTFTTAKSAA